MKMLYAVTYSGGVRDYALCGVRHCCEPFVDAVPWPVQYCFVDFSWSQCVTLVIDAPFSFLQLSSVPLDNVCLLGLRPLRTPAELPSYFLKAASLMGLQAGLKSHRIPQDVAEVAAVTGVACSQLAARSQGLCEGRHFVPILFVLLLVFSGQPVFQAVPCGRNRGGGVRLSGG